MCYASVHAWPLHAPMHILGLESFPFLLSSSFIRYHSSSIVWFYDIFVDYAHTMALIDDDLA